MGCMNSKAVTANAYPIESSNTLAATGGGSLILSTNKHNASNVGGKDLITNEGNSNGSSLLLSGGGGSNPNSYVIGKKEIHNSWEPGTAIDRPLNTKETQIVWLPLDSTIDTNTSISTSFSNESHPPSSSSTLTLPFSSSSSTSVPTVPLSSIPSTNPLPPSTAQMYLRISYACHSRQGRTPKPPYKPNQDTFISLSSLGNNPSLALFGVFDGHGPRGEEASQFARYNIPDATVRHPQFTQSPMDSFISSFELTHQRFISPLTAQSGVDTAVSGTTAITVLFNKDQYICANVGDSRAIIGSRNPQKGLVAKALSSDHKPQRPDERARIQRTNAKILSENQLGIENGDPDKWYVCRVHNGTIRYGVLFTRSLGDADAHNHLGLIATPEIRKGKLDPHKDRFMVIASDGVWDYLGEDSVARIVAQATGMPLSTAAAGNEERLNNLDIQATDKVQTAVDALVNAANAKWEAEGDNRRDDITVIVLMFRTVTMEEMIQEQIERKLIPDPRQQPTNQEEEDDDEEEEGEVNVDHEGEEIPTRISAAEDDEEENDDDDGTTVSDEGDDNTGRKTSSSLALSSQNDSEANNGENSVDDNNKDNDEPTTDTMNVSNRGTLVQGNSTTQNTVNNEDNEIPSVYTSQPLPATGSTGTIIGSSVVLTDIATTLLDSTTRNDGTAADNEDDDPPPNEMISPLSKDNEEEEGEVIVTSSVTTAILDEQHVLTDRSETTSP